MTPTQLLARAVLDLIEHGRAMAVDVADVRHVAETGRVRHHDDDAGDAGDDVEHQGDGLDGLAAAIEAARAEARAEALAEVDAIAESGVKVSDPAPAGGRKSTTARKSAGSTRKG